MIFCSLLAGLVVWAMSWGRLPAPYLAAASVATALLLGWAALRHHHSHSEFIAVDFYAQNSRLSRLNPGLKALFFTAVLLLCVASDSWMVSLAVFVTMIVLTVVAGGTKPGVLISLMTVPAAFILLSSLALLFDFSATPAGALNLRFFGVWLCVAQQAQSHAFLVTVKAFGAISCLYALSLSTPMAELIGVMRRIHLPAIVIELMYLIYRYIFILLAVYGQIRAAAASRLGFINARGSLRAFGSCCANLLVQSFRRAGACYDAMESRCYEGKLAFMQTPKPVRPLEAAAGCAYFCAMTALAVATRV